jgi:DNA-binding response OmpR family regulator
MFSQSVSIVEFPKLYNILKEIESLFKFNINNYQTVSDFINLLGNNNQDISNSIIILEKKNNQLSSLNQINSNAILIFDNQPFKINQFIDTVNTQLIKQKYNFQSKISIKNYVLNFNSRMMSTSSKELKLTEREIDIILFLSQNKTPQSISVLQNKVWGYTFDLETHTVETHIYRLRKKIKDKFDDDKFIISHDEGYLV